MDALIAKADAIQPLNSKPKSPYAGTKRKRKSTTKDNDDPHNTRNDHTLHSVSAHTKTPKSLSSISANADNVPHYTPTQISSKKLRTKLHTQHTLTAQYASHTSDTQHLLELAAEDVGGIQTTSPLEKTWRLTQDEIASSSGGEASKGRRELLFPPSDGGVGRLRWTRNGRHLLLTHGKANSTISSVDWLTGRVNASVNLAVGNGGAGGMGGKSDAARDVCFLQDQSFWAVAQRRNVFVYDRDGVEIHKLGKIVDPVRLEFLPWHWLLVSVTNTSHLIYTDTTTGSIVAQHAFSRSSASSVRLSPALCLAQNPHTAVTYMGHTNGQVSLWTPNMSRPVVQVLAHLGGVVSVGVDPSDRGGGGASPNTLGRYMATAGRDHKVKVWDCRYWKGVVREWAPRSGGGGKNHAHADIELEWSQRGYLAVASGGSVNVYHPPSITTPFTSNGGGNGPPPPLYLTHPIPHRPISSVRFEPYTDVLAIGHSKGLSSILVPGAGEPQFDSLDADPYENAKARREREVKGLLDKLSPDMISLDPSFIGTLDSAISNRITEDGVRTTTAAQSILDDRDRKRLPVSSVQSLGGQGKEYARMSRVERLGASGKLDLSEVGGKGTNAKIGKDQGSGGESESSSDEGGSEGEDKEEGEGGHKKEEKEKKRLRGRNKALKRYLRKQRKNVVDPAVIAIRAKVEKIKAEEKERRTKAKLAREKGSAVQEDGGELKRRSALDRFAKKSG